MEKIQKYDGFLYDVFSSELFRVELSAFDILRVRDRILNFMPE
jgi:hypothetical protein